MAKQKAGRKHAHKGVHCIVKRGKGNVCANYDERKVYGSVYAACYIVGEGEKTCESIADKVSKSVTKLVKKKKEISSEVISKHVTKELKKHNKHASFMYDTHRDLS
jgi:transcriptional regulator NrdR family protein